MNNIKEDGEGSISIGDAGTSTDILANGSGEQTELGVLGPNNFNFPVRLGKIKKRIMAEYIISNKK